MSPKRDGQRVRERWGVVALVLISGLWSLLLPFQLDDYSQIAQAERQLAEVASAPWLRLQGQELPPNYLFRPVLWTSFVATLKLGGGVALTGLFHLVALCWQLAGSLALLAVARRLLPDPPKAAFLATAFFVLHPAGLQAMSWVAAGGDLLATFFMLLALRSALRSSPDEAPRYGRAGIWLALGVASKVSAWLGAPIVGSICLLRSRGGWRSRFFGGLRFLVPLLVLGALRWSHTGSLSSSYSGGTSLEFGNLNSLLPAIPKLARQLTAPWCVEAPAEEMALLARWFSGADTLWLLLPFGLLTLFALALRPRRLLFVTLAASVTFAILAIGPLFLLRQTLDANRALHALLIPPALLFGAAAGTLLAARGGQRVAIALIALQLFISGDALVHRARVELHAGRLIRARLHQVEEVLASNSDDHAVVVIEDQKFDGWAGVPLLGPMVGRAFEPPFRNPARRVQHVFREAELLHLDGPLRTLRPSLTLLLGTERGYRILGKLPARPDPEALSFRAGSGGWIPARTLPARGVRALELTLAVPAAQRAYLSVEGVGIERAGWVDFPDSGRLVCGPDPDLEWLLTPELRRLRVLDPDGSELVLKSSPRLRASLPSLEARSPKSGLELPLQGVPTFELVLPPVSGLLRLRSSILFHGLAFDMVYACQVRGGGRTSWRPREEERVSASFPELSWATLGALYETYARDRGIKRLEFRWTASLVTPDASWVLARGEEQILHLIPPR